MEDQKTSFERYRKEIYRIGWRLQYKVRKTRNQEFPIFESEQLEEDFTLTSENKVVVRYLLDVLPDNGKSILDKIYLQGFTEAEVAKQLNISQQAVNRCKRKMLSQLFQKVSS